MIGGGSPLHVTTPAGERDWGFRWCMEESVARDRQRLFITTAPWIDAVDVVDDRGPPLPVMSPVSTRS
ncbi:hypothetical protein E2C01_097662 [Portunus trituberculatus]|uniref:Uncharacterized protein n=1 Tax=Portunus trituberculatus TaxID=210409 RepID=A0A5B7K6B8_PORTR|nr:hypothetical protein [Portunus trituberculatus]